MKRLVCTAAAVLFSLSTTLAGEVSPVQSSKRPGGLEIVAPVQVSGSDARAEDFNANFLPYFLELVNTQLKESVDFTDREGFRLDASKLFLRTESDLPIRIYFVHEGAGYHNTLGLAMTPAGAPEMGTKHIVFPDASFSGKSNRRGPSNPKRTNSEPLAIGDFVEISKGAPGIQMDFFLNANGAKNSIGVWYNDESLNEDGKQHVVAFLLPGSRYVMIGFEDLWGGGDLDYNDCIFVIDVGEVNAANLFDIEGTLPN